MARTADLAGLYGSGAVRTFLGLEACDDLDRLEAPIALIGAAGATSYPSVDAFCRHARTALRRALAPLAANVDRYDFDSGGRLFPTDAAKAVDCGDLAFDEPDFAANRAVVLAGGRVDPGAAARGRPGAAQGRIVTLSFVEFMPERDVDGLGALAIGRLIATALGVVARQPA